MEIPLDLSVRGRRLEVVQPGEIAQVLARRKSIVEAGLLGKDPDRPAQCRVVDAQSVPRDDRVAVGRSDQGREHSNRRGLPRPIRSEEAEHRPGFDAERESLDGDPAIEAARQSMSLDRVSHSPIGR